MSGLIRNVIERLKSTSGADMIGASGGAWGTVQAFITALLSTAGASLIGFVQAGAGAVKRAVQDVLREHISVKDFGAVGNGITNDTAAILLAKAYAIENLPCTLHFPKGVYLYSSLGNMAYKGLTLQGSGDRETVLKCSAPGVALAIDAFAAGLTANDATAQFIQGMNVLGMTVEGNALTTKIIAAQGIARSKWQVVARTAEPTAGIAFDLKGVMLSELNLKCSTDYDAMASIPYEGLRMDEGRRVGVSVGNSSNNTIRHYMEGLGKGTNLVRGDQNTFLGGSDESCTVYGLIVGVYSRFNTWIGTGFENVAATADVADAGIQSQFLNCYASKKFILQGRQAKVSGGYFERLQIDQLAAKNTVENITVNHWATGAGGVFDAGIASEFKSIYDASLSAFIYPRKDRTGIAVTDSPFSFTNTTGEYIEVIVQSGIVTAILSYRGTDFWQKKAESPSCHLLAPLDRLLVSYSAAPQMSYLPHNGFQG